MYGRSQKVMATLLQAAYDGSDHGHHLMFTEDSTVNDDAEATNILCDTAHIAKSYGLNITEDKTKVLTTDESKATVHLKDV